MVLVLCAIYIQCKRRLQEEQQEARQVGVFTGETTDHKSAYQTAIKTDITTLHDDLTKEGNKSEVMSCKKTGTITALHVPVLLASELWRSQREFNSHIYEEKTE